MIGRALAPIVLMLVGAAAAPAGGFDPAYHMADAHRLAVDDFEIVYYERGKGEAVVFFHPQMDFRGWQAQIEAVAAAGYHAVAFSYDPATLVPGELDAAPLIAALEALRAGLDLGTIHFVGHSMGGLQGMMMAAERPDLLASLTLEEPAPTGLDISAVMPRCALPPDDPGFSFCMFMSIIAGPGDFEKRSEAQRAYLATPTAAAGPAPPPAADDGAPPAGVAVPDVCGRVARISVPVLFIRGEKTPAFFQKGLDHHESCLPGHERLVIAGASHMAHLDGPAAYDRALLSFIRTHGG